MIKLKRKKNEKENDAPPHSPLFLRPVGFCFTFGLPDVLAAEAR